MADTPDDIKDKTLEQLRTERELLLATEERSETQERILAGLQEEIKLRTQSTAAIEKQIELQKKYIADLGNLSKNLDNNLLKREAEIELTNQQLNLAKKNLALGGAGVELHAKEITEFKKKLDAQNAILDASKEFNKSLDTSTGLSRKVTQGLLMVKVASEDWGAAMKSAGATLFRLADSAASSFIDKQISSIHELLVSYDKQSTAFEKQYALGEASQDQIKSLYKEMNKYGASVEDVTKAYGALATGFTDFTMIAGTQQKAIAETATTLERAYGIANGDFASGMQNATKMMGMTAAQAEGYQRELAATAEALGVPPAQLAAQFASMGPQFAKFGNQAGKAFKDLARISKITGMELEKVLAITNKFDTFEGAAEQAGQLNAALGGNFVNAMDLMMATDPAERFGMIRDAITSTGLSFDDMSYYQKQFYTNSLGLSDVGDLALMMSGNMDMMSGSSNESAAALIEQKQRAQDLMTVQERINAMFAENSELMIDYLENIEYAAKLMQEHGRTILGVAIGLKALSVATGAYSAVKTISTAKTLVNIEAILSETAAQEASTAAQKKSIPVIKGAGKTAGAAALKMIAFGAAIALIGGGIYLAATGIGNMAESFKGLNGWATAALVGVLVGMGGAIYGLSTAYATAATTVAAAAPGFLAGGEGLIIFGAGVLLVGAGVGVAAAGMGLLYEGISKIVDSLSGGIIGIVDSLSGGIIGIVDSLKAFVSIDLGIAAKGVGTLALSFYALAHSLAALGNPLSLLGIGALSAVSDIMANKMMKGLSTTIDVEGVFSAMGDVTEEKMLKIQTGFAAIASSINGINAFKIVPLAMAMTAVAAAPAAAASPTSTSSTSATSNAGTVAKLTVQFVLDNEVFETKVVKVVQSQIGGFSIDAAASRE